MYTTNEPNRGIVIVKPEVRVYLAFEPLLFSYSCYRVGPAVAFHAVDTQIKCMHKQGEGERSEPHSL